MSKATRQIKSTARAIASTDNGELKQFAFFAVALVLEFTTMIAG